MIVAERKSLDEIIKMVEGFEKILVIGCGTCVTVCYAGGDKEAKIVASGLTISRKMGGKPISTEVVTPERQCEWEYLDEIKELVEWSDAVISMACAAGIQAVAEYFPTKPVFPGVDTKFIGMPQEQGLWIEKCAACGKCILDKTAAICVITRCSKGLINGPCGRAINGMCEIDPQVECGWEVAYKRMKTLQKLDIFSEVLKPKNWSSRGTGGPGKVVREDMRL